MGVKEKIRFLRGEWYDRLKRRYAYNKEKLDCPYPPIIFGVEFTNVCNLECLYCLREPMKARKMGYMDPGEFDRLLEDHKEKMGYIQLLHHGESFLHPNFVKMMEIARKHELPCRITTNVTEVKGDKALAAIQTLKEICFSFDAPTKEYFEKLRAGADYEECVKNIKEFCELNDSVGHPVEVWINIVRTDYVDKHMGDFIKEWGNIVDVIQFTQLGDWSGHKDVSAFGEVRAPYKKFRCGFPWGGFYITWDGELFPCCNWEPIPTDSMGNIFEDDLESVWNGDRYKEFRRRHIEKDFVGTYCEKCQDPWRAGVDMEPIPKWMGFKTFVFVEFMKYLWKSVKRHLSRKKEVYEEAGDDWCYKAKVLVQTSQETEGNRGQITNPRYMIIKGEIIEIC